MNKIFAFAIALTSTAGFAADNHDHAHDAHQYHAQEQAARAHGAHEHGAAHLDIVLENRRAYIYLKSPAANIVGFEHHPQTDGQQAALTAALRTLQNPELFHFEGSQCRLADTQVETGLQDEHANGHADFEAEYIFECGDTASIHALETHLFQSFPGIEHLRVQFIKGSHQGASHLTAANPMLRF